MKDSRALLRGGQGMRGSLALIAAAAVGLLAAPDRAQGQCQYEVTAIIQAPPCFITGPPNTFAQGMNVHGHVVGYYWDCVTSGVFHGFVWTPENGFVTLPTPEGGYRNTPSDINDSGFIVGTHTFWQGDTQRGYIFNPATQQYTYFEPKHGVGHSWANAINNNGLVAGARVISKPGESPPISNAVIWDTNTGEVIDLGDMGVGPLSGARMINDDGSKVIGWTGGQFTPTGFFLDLDANPVDPAIFDQSQGLAGVGSNLFALTSDGLVGGAGSFDGGPSNGFLWKKGVLKAVIDPLPGHSGSSVAAMNDLGQALIRSTPGNALGLWQHDVQIPLVNLIKTPPDNLAWPATLNNAGQILARATVSGKTVGVVLSPVDGSVTDLNADCTTDVHDLLMLLMQWGPCATDNCSADFTGNGVVNVFDLLFMLANWG